jgi:hypothetical protein
MPQTSIKDLVTIAALELSNALQNPAPADTFSHIGTEQLQVLRQLSEIFSASLPSTTTQHAPPISQASSQFRSKIPPGPVTLLSPPIQAQPSQQHRASLHALTGEGEPYTGAISEGGT